MELKFQYNKVDHQKFQNAVKVRERALPILRAKEAALRVEVKERKKKIEEMETKLQELEKPVNENMKIWSEFPDIIKIGNINREEVSIAGVHVYHFQGVDYHIDWFSVYEKPKWLLEGLSILRAILNQYIHLKMEKENLKRLSEASKKTTQKVNLYEKIQIPAYNKAMLQIKRFLEDEENLSRAGQKIMKKRKAT